MAELLQISEFILKIQEKLLSYMAKEFQQDYHVDLKKVQIKGKDVTAICLQGGADDKTAPCLIAESIYELLYKKKFNGDFEKFIKEVAISFENQLRKVQSPIQTQAVQEDAVKIDIHKVFFAAINYEANKDMLETVPHEVTGDVALVYRVIIADNEDEFKSILINDNILKAFEKNGFDYEDIKAAAAENTSELFPTKLIRITDDAYLVTSEKYTFGASTILYEDSSIQELSERSGKDVLIIPFSINTCFAILVDQVDKLEYDEYNKAIAELNAKLEEPALNDRVMLYSGEKKELLYGKEAVVNTVQQIRNSGVRR